jgi:hypothetical protein
MSTFKIFDGTNWVDPCTCDVKILDIGGTQFQKIDPTNCLVSYFDGVNWCPITCPCECPAGYTFDVETNSCKLVTIYPATPSGGTTCDVIHGDLSPAYGEFGARLYQDISTKIFPLHGFQNTATCGAGSNCYIVKENAGLGTTTTIQQQSIPTSIIFDSQGSSLKGRLNIAGLWATGYTVDEWLNVSFCINISVQKTVVFAIAGDNQIRANITSTTFNGGGTTNLVNLWASEDPSGTPSNTLLGNTFKFWHMFPITLPAGSHTIELSGMNFAGPASFAAEIYDIPIPTLISLMTSSTAVETALEPYILFSTKSLITTPPLVIAAVGQTITWSCPGGELLTDCYGVPSCVTIESVPCGTVLS